jgi:hypothetical protein
MRKNVGSRSIHAGDERPETASGVRSAAVAFGPSLLLVGLVVASTFAALRWAVKAIHEWRPTSGPFDVACSAQSRCPGGASNVIPLLGAALPWIYALGRHRWVLSWGARPEETRRRLPGDAVVPDPVWSSTRAITIGAPVEAVWPWLAQMGQDRGGLYSYDWLENLAGLAIHSADRIHPEWQDVQVGDIVPFAPNQDTMVVTYVELNRALVWRILTPTPPQTDNPAGAGSSAGRKAHGGPGGLDDVIAAPGSQPREADSVAEERSGQTSGPGGRAPDATWAFILEPEGADRTRLIQRFRFGGQPRLALAVAYGLAIELPHFIMERRMLLGIRDRAERACQARSIPAGTRAA